MVKIPTLAADNAKCKNVPIYIFVVVLYIGLRYSEQSLLSFYYKNCRSYRNPANAFLAKYTI